LKWSSNWARSSQSSSLTGGASSSGRSHTTAAECSFLAAIPLITAATGLDLYQSRELLVLADLPLFAVGFLVAFGSALLALRVLPAPARHHDAAAVRLVPSGRCVRPARGPVDGQMTREDAETVAESSA